MDYYRDSQVSTSNSLHDVAMMATILTAHLFLTATCGSCGRHDCCASHVHATVLFSSLCLKCNPLLLPPGPLFLFVDTETEDGWGLRDANNQCATPYVKWTAVGGVAHGVAAAAAVCVCVSSVCFGYCAFESSRRPAGLAAARAASAQSPVDVEAPSASVSVGAPSIGAPRPRPQPHQ